MLKDPSLISRDDGVVVPLGPGVDTGVHNPHGYTLNYNGKEWVITVEPLIIKPLLTWMGILSIMATHLSPQLHCHNYYYCIISIGKNTEIGHPSVAMVKLHSLVVATTEGKPLLQYCYYWLGTRHCFSHFRVCRLWHISSEDEVSSEVEIPF